MIYTIPFEVILSTRRWSGEFGLPVYDFVTAQRSTFGVVFTKEKIFGRKSNKRVVGIPQYLTKFP